MLVLSRNCGSGVFLGSDIQVILESTKGNRAKLRVTAPRFRSIRRSTLVPKDQTGDDRITRLGLTLKIGQSLIIDEIIEIKLLKKSGTFGFGIEAPMSVKILRTELDERRLT